MSQIEPSLTDSTDPPDPPASASDDPFPYSGGKQPPEKRRGGRWIIEAVTIVVIAVVLAVVVRTFVFQTFYIPSASMEPTLQIGDRILVNKLTYDYSSVKRFNVIVFARPPKEDCGGPPVADLVKRVIGLPGERISSQGNEVLIDGRPLSEPFLPKGLPLGIPIPPQTIPKNQYFVMGDNRPDSCDSRTWGTVSKSLIVGKVEFTWWPLSHFKLF